MIKNIKKYPLISILGIIIAAFFSVSAIRLIYLATHPEAQKALYQQNYNQYIQNFIKDANSEKLPAETIKEDALMAHHEIGKRYLTYGYAFCLPNYGAESLKGYCFVNYPKNLKDVHPGKEGIPIKFEEPNQEDQFVKCIMAHDKFNQWLPQKSCMVLLDGKIELKENKKEYFLVKRVIKA